MRTLNKKWSIFSDFNFSYLWKFEFYILTNYLSILRVSKLGSNNRPFLIRWLQINSKYLSLILNNISHSNVTSLLSLEVKIVQDRFKTPGDRCLSLVVFWSIMYLNKIQRVLVMTGHFFQWQAKKTRFHKNPWTEFLRIYFKNRQSMFLSDVSSFTNSCNMLHSCYTFSLHNLYIWNFSFLNRYCII